MMYEAVSVKLTGIAPLLAHNGQLSDPLNEFAQALARVTSKRRKTADDHAEMSRLEFLGSIYVNEDGRVCIPGENLEALVIDGAKKDRRGNLARAGVIVDENPALIYSGPRDPEKLFENANFVSRARVKVGQAAVMRTRPIFHDWSLEFEVKYLPSTIDREHVIRALERGGSEVGLGDWRPRYGRFELEAN